ncbi:hypothetical protein CBL_08461 [Carabus blaptoides fortunei]
MMLIEEHLGQSFESEDEFDISDSEEHNRNEKNQNYDIYDINSMPLMFEDGIIVGIDDDKNSDDEIIDEDVPEKDIPPPRDPKKRSSRVLRKQKNLKTSDGRWRPLEVFREFISSGQQRWRSQTSGEKPRETVNLAYVKLGEVPLRGQLIDSDQ